MSPTSASETHPTHLDLTTVDGLTASRLTATDSGARSSSAALSQVTGVDTANLGLWHAEPGRYEHPGGHEEHFVVVAGHATFEASGLATVELSPGSYVRVPAATPSTMTVHSTLRKLSVTFN